ncbi:MAG: hypothetical protein HQL41_05090 [Alphaproteobacteria bacterium]|nr:hypothetical protein [Alphaproteobacteria bacterium]
MSAIDTVFPALDVVRSLYKSLSACADHHDQALIEQLHIATAIDDAILMSAKQDKVVIVTGNTGDGKTHLIKQVEGQFNKTFTINKDANEVEDDEIIQSIDNALANKETLIIAINEGILLDICEQAKTKCPWAPQVIDAILRPYVYDSNSTKELDGIVILDLNLRNNLSRAVVSQAIEKVAGFVDVASDPSGLLKDNADSIRRPVVKDRITHLLDAVARTGFHATMRELLGFCAHLICGGEDEEQGIPPRPYYINAFDGGQGPLFDLVRRYDPLFLPSPFLDDKLFIAQDKPEDWEVDRPDEIRVADDPDLFRQRKRRAYFEHKLGHGILRGERSEVDRAFHDLTKADQAPEQVAIRLLNRFYNSKDTQTDQLTLWVSHQYNARPPRYVASRQVISATEFEVRIPRLPPHLKHVFANHYPDHVILAHNEMEPGEGLVIDRRLVSMLIAGDRISGLGTRNFEAQTKIAALYDALARVSSSQQSVVQIMRLDSMKKVKIGVNVANRTYYIPGG